MDEVIVYIHGQGGSPEEARHFEPLFGHSHVIGLDYRAQSPQEAKEEFPKLFDALCGPDRSVKIIANSIGAFFAMSALQDRNIREALFISPVVDMQKLIEDMMGWAGVSEAKLREKGEIETAFGQKLSWPYLCYVREHPIRWTVPTHILYGGKDNLTSFETISAFAAQTGASLTVMESGEHWFHTEEQMEFLDRWIESLIRPAAVELPEPGQVCARR